MMRPHPRSEDTVQAEIVTYLRTVLTRDYRVFAIPNGGVRSKAEASRMKATGTLAGVFDLCILGPGGRTFWIETKTARGRLSDAQTDMRDWMMGFRIPHVVARSIDDVRTALLLWGIATREAA